MERINKIIALGLAALLSSPTLALPAKKSCEEALQAPLDLSPEESLRGLLQSVEGLDFPPPWTEIVSHYLLPATRIHSPNLVLTLVGPTNVGKSLVFNSLPGLRDAEPASTTQPPSPSSFDAESTARPVIMVNSGLFDDQGNFDLRFTGTERWRSPTQVAKPGPPLVYPVNQFFRHLIFIDSPAFSTAETQGAVLRDLKIADVIIYVFSNANYADDSALEFLRERLNENGPRDIILIYNVNAAIPREIADGHFEFVVRRIFKIDPQAPLPPQLIGAYHMVHSNRVASGEEAAEFIPYKNSMPFPELLNALDENSASHRRQSLNLSLQHVLSGAEQTRIESERESAELALAEKIFDAYLKVLVKEAVQHLPLESFNSELAKAWNRRSSGLRGFAHWLASPMEMMGHHGEKSHLEPAVREIERYLDNAIEKIMAELRLGIAEGVLRLNDLDPETKAVIEAVKDFRAAYSNRAELTPNFIRTNGHFEIHLPQSKTVRAYTHRLLERDWQTIVGEMKKDAKENFSNLTLQIRTELDQIVKSQDISIRARQGLYTTLAIIPAIVAVSYMAYRGTGLIEVQTLASIFGAHLAARFFVNLNHKALGIGWNQSIRSWLEQRQIPRLDEILARHMRLRSTDRKVSTDSASMSRLIRHLEQMGIHDI